MSEYDNTNRGQIWGNKKKESDKHPDFTGTLNVEGVEYWVSGWKRKEGAHDKAPAMSFSIKLKEDGAKQSKPTQAKQPQASNSFDDDIPFMWHGSSGAGVDWRNM